MSWIDSAMDKTWDLWIYNTSFKSIESTIWLSSKELFQYSLLTSIVQSNTIDIFKTNCYSYILTIVTFTPFFYSLNNLWLKENKGGKKMFTWKIKKR